ncbi:MAG: hypothetical protein PHY09_12760 [Desulfuromonadaceae bacterium]|nr:hypothetical protein [Desulfuromonadaceae bacterium]MDD5106885.1 hypothetical protein [Desulfuromonadaceae bacterium]
MSISSTTLKIQTLGCFTISINGKPVATEWPDEAGKILFCSLLSPLDMYFTWDRLCRSILDRAEAQTNRHHLEVFVLRPLNTFLNGELGFSPLISGPEGIRINQLSVHIDAFEFYRDVLEGLRLSSFTNYLEAAVQFSRARSLYAGSYLPGISGKIINNTRRELECLYQTCPH